MAENSIDSGLGRLDGTAEPADGALDSLGSLTQQARLKRLKTARNIFVIIGLLTIVINGIGFAMSESIIDAQMQKEAEQLRRQGLQIDQDKYQELRASVVRLAKVLSVIMILVGVVYLVFAVVVDKYPVPITISGLVVYLGAAAVMALLDPESIGSGILVKIIVVVALVKAVQAALAYQRELKQSDVIMAEPA